MRPHAKQCTGLCGRPVCRDERKARMRRQWEAREARRPPLAERLAAAFKATYASPLVDMVPNMRRSSRRLFGPEYRAMDDANDADRCARLPKVVVQDNAWRARFA